MNLDHLENVTEEFIERKSPFCIIAKNVWENGGRDIQTCDAWASNPYPDTYAVVPDEMVESIMETCGFCDIELNEEGTEVVSFTAREIPVLSNDELEPTENELLWQAITDLEIGQMEQDQALTDLEIAQLEGSAEE